MARRWPAAVRSRIQSPSLISQVTMQPASGLPCSTEAVIASVSSTSMLSRRSRSHTFQARLAIGKPFHSISGMLMAATTGLALNAIISDSVGSASGERRENADGGGGALACASALGAAAGAMAVTKALRSARLVVFTRASRARSTGSWAGSYSSTSEAQP